LAVRDLDRSTIAKNGGISCGPGAIVIFGGVGRRDIPELKECRPVTVTQLSSSVFEGSHLSVVGCRLSKSESDYLLNSGKAGQ